MGLGGISFCCVSLSSLSPEQGWGEGGRLHGKSQHQGDGRKRKENRPDSGLQDLMGVAHQSTWEGWGDGMEVLGWQLKCSQVAIKEPSQKGP